MKKNLFILIIMAYILVKIGSILAKNDADLVEVLSDPYFDQNAPLHALVRGARMTEYYILHKHSSSANCSKTEFILKLTLYLLNRGANLNLRDDSGQTPLHAAVNSRNPIPELVKAIIKNKGKPNIKDFKDNTPLYYALKKLNELARSGKSTKDTSDIIKKISEVITILIASGASINEANINGQKPLDFLNDQTTNFLKIFDGKTITLKAQCARKILVDNLARNTKHNELPRELWEYLQDFSPTLIIPDESDKTCTIL
ncbi:hypothetical protein KAW80_01175 [Candidatus Babeliales bacterium]|nr:hypothetical protein [Candidatus Babeliales bacterium]